jgi:hypothetical protein
VVPTFCRHNRFAAECPICAEKVSSRSDRPARRRTRAPEGRRSRSRAAPPPAYKGPYAAAGPYEEEDGSYEVRLERVPGGLRLAEWAMGSIRRRAPVLETADLPGLVREAGESGAMQEDDAAALLEALEASGAKGSGVSAGVAGELREELRVEQVADGRIRVGRWILRPNRGWELQEAPVMLPLGRYVEAIAAATG